MLDPLLNGALWGALSVMEPDLCDTMLIVGLGIAVGVVLIVLLV